MVRIEFQPLTQNAGGFVVYLVTRKQANMVYLLAHLNQQVLPK